MSVTGRCGPHHVGMSGCPGLSSNLARARSGSLAKSYILLEKALTCIVAE